MKIGFAWAGRSQSAGEAGAIVSELHGHLKWYRERSMLPAEMSERVGGLDYEARWNGRTVVGLTKTLLLGREPLSLNGRGG